MTPEREREIRDVLSSKFWGHVRVDWFMSALTDALEALAAARAAVAPDLQLQERLANDAARAHRAEARAAELELENERLIRKLGIAAAAVPDEPATEAPTDGG